MRDPMPTTRRARFLWRKKRYTLKAQRAATWKFDWIASPTGKALRNGVKGNFQQGPKQEPTALLPKNYVHSLDMPPPFTVTFTISEIGPMMPPHVKITNAPYLEERALNRHHSFPALRYHAKRMIAYRRLSSVKRSKRDRQITGCNWFFFREGIFAMDDVLGRHPNAEDIANGAPYPVTFWPVPLGY